MSKDFTRERVMHGLKRRRLAVVHSELIAPRMLRVTLGGEDLADFAALGPADHLKVFLPDPETGEFVLPEFVNGRPKLPEGAAPLVRDYTPYAVRLDGESGPEIDIDFVLHGNGTHADRTDRADGAHSTSDAVSGQHRASEHGGPAASWAAAAKPGDPVYIGGPRGSLLAPEGVERLVIIADESALPATARWLDALSGVPTIGLFSVENEATSAYLASRETPGREFRWFGGEDRDARIAAALHGIAPDEGTFYFFAGEATSLIPLRRYLRRELGLPKQQVDVHGYWRRGTAALDHHAPLDPTHPDD